MRHRKDVSDDALVAVLKWAAGGAEPVIDRQASVDSVDNRLLLGLIQRHRLAARFRALARNRPLPWCRPQLTVGVWKLAQFAQDSLRRQVAVTEEVTAALSPPAETPLITVKGLATYALTGDARNVRHSHDIDLMFPDMERLHGALTGIGFAGEPWKRAAHEYSEMKRGDQTIEPHLRFPVFSYPKPRPPDLLPTRNPGHWVQNARNRVEWKIGYDDLLQHCQRGVTPETRALVVPNPAMATLMLCAHEFREFLQRPCRGAVVHLSTLADIRDLAGLEGFRRGEFLSLVHQFDGADSVQFVRYLHRSYLGSDPLPFFSAFAPIPSRYAFPQFLTYYGCWADLDEEPDDLLLPTTTGAVFRLLQPNAVVAKTGGPSPTYTGLSDGPEPRIERVVIQTARDTPWPVEAGMPFAVRAERDADALRVEVVLRTPLEVGRNYQVKLYSSDGINAYHNVSRRVPEDRPGGAPPGCELDQTRRDSAVGVMEGEQCHIRFTLPWEQLPPRLRAAPQVPVMLTITGWPLEAEDKFESADPVLAVPLNIT